MSPGKFVFPLAALLALSIIALAFPNSGRASGQMQRQAISGKASHNSIRLAQAASEKEAFEGAKDLGTLEAWEAFLNSFPTGFRADLVRAYVRRLGSEGNATPAPVQAAPQPPVAPPPQPIVQPPPPPPPPPAPLLQPIHLGPDASPWGNGNYAMDEGNASAFSASVRSSGLEFTAFCNVNRQLITVLGESNRGVYPDFDQRIEQGLSASRGQYGTPDQRISIHFTNGNEHILPAHIMGLTGEVAISSEQTGGGFEPSGSFINDMMSAKTMTLSSPPLGVTFQLTGSRLALCNVFKQCGVSTPACARYAPAPVSTYAPAPKKKVYKKKVYKKKKTVKKKKKSSTKTTKKATKPAAPAGGSNPIKIFPGTTIFLSDVRLKVDVTHLFTLENGTRLYSFRYPWETTQRVGVLAQDLLAREATRDAVVKLQSGHYGVQYSKLGLRMTTLEEWREKGLASVLASPRSRIR